MQKFFKNNSTFRKILSLSIGACFLSLLVSISIPSLHAKLHEMEQAKVFGAESQHNENGHTTDHSETCHFCQVVHHFASDNPTLAVDLTANLLPQNHIIPQDNHTYLLTVLRTSQSRAPPSNS